MARKSDALPMDGHMALRAFIAQRFPLFGQNKQQELVRLVFEIAKREKIPEQTVIAGIPPDLARFDGVKAELMQRRFPDLAAAGVRVSESFPAVDIHPECQVVTQRDNPFSPQRVYIEQAVEKSELAGRVRRMFPQARVEVISGYREFTAERNFSVRDYNQRTDNLFIVHEQFDHFKPCPCSKGVAGCGYHNVNLGFGCPFECSYCFLQSYTNAPGIVFPANLGDFFVQFSSYRRGIRVGSGETTDSLAFDHITQFSGQIVEFFRHHPESIFEFKTKSSRVAGLLAVKAASNIACAWSLNPQVVIDSEEFLTASLVDRLAAARACAEAGYRTAFHFDPVFYYRGWEQDYASVVNDLFRHVAAASMVWISLGTLRMTIAQKKMIENRFPGNTILDAELVTGTDSKLRYHESVRRDIYRTMLALIRERSAGKVPVYLCMEPVPVWNMADLPLLGSQNLWSWK